MKNFLLFIFISNIQVEASTLCAGENVTSQPVLDYCYNQTGYIVHRCCRSNDNASFIALDLTGLNLTKIPDFTDIHNFDLVVIDFRENFELNSSDGDFLSLKYLDDLYLPEQFKCPGGDSIWEVITNTTDIAGNHCKHQRDCSNSTDICVEHGSYCSTNGPNHFLCLCKDGYKGYKCLRHGKFPTAAVFGPTIGVTVFVSVLLYWTQRRHVTK